MKKIEDLKKELLSGNVSNFYVFYGEDYGIRKHYIDYIKKFYGKVIQLNSGDVINERLLVKTSIFDKSTKLYICYGDIEFAQHTPEYFGVFIKNLKTNGCILIYENGLESSNLFKHYDKHITYFPIVEDNVAVEFVDSELDIGDSAKRDLAINCDNNYNNILLESDKIKNYAQAKGVSEQNSYESLKSKNQLLVQQPIFESSDFMNCLLTHNYIAMETHIKTAMVDIDRFCYSLPFIFNDFIIAGLLKKYGRIEGGSRAYGYGLNWGRAKVLRDLDIVDTADYLFESAYQVSLMDYKLKTGGLTKDSAVDYFICTII